LDLPFKKKTVFLASSGRSGSTWIQEMLTKSNSYRIMFEPFHSNKIELLSEWHYRQYIGRNDSGVEFREDIESILWGRIRHDWVDQDNSVIFPRKRLIKDIRANLFLAWLSKNFPHLRIIFLMRHPFSVARSRLKLGWEADLSIFFRQNVLMERHFLNDVAYLNSISSPFAKQVAFWSIENIVPLRELSNNEALPVSYEEMKANPEYVLSRIFSFLEESEVRLTKDTISQPSRTSFTNKSETSEVDCHDKEEALSVLERFGLDNLYGPEEDRARYSVSDDIFKNFSMVEH
jgi:hypothetical protein